MKRSVHWMKLDVYTAGFNGFWKNVLTVLEKSRSFFVSKSVGSLIYFSFVL